VYSSFDFALEEIALVLFTTIAPVGACSCIILALILIFSRTESAEYLRLSKRMIVPITIATLGFVASATHLGTPENALYAFTGVGRSPLSNEIFFAVVFLALGGSFWLVSYSRQFQQPRLHIAHRLWCAAIVLTGSIFIAFAAFAYHVDTIITWKNSYVPINLIVGAVTGGSLLTILTLKIAGWPSLKRMSTLLCLIAVVALAANGVVLFLQNLELPMATNLYGTAVDLVPRYSLAIGVYLILGSASIALTFWVTRREASVSVLLGLLLLFFIGLFPVRFSFYMMHMIVGLGL
jgi:anaerobic dimethyl sulfoxide reductase subunit C (anchor subunit)